MYFVLSVLLKITFFCGEIYITGKNFTLPPAVTALTNLTSVLRLPLLMFIRLSRRRLSELGLKELTVQGNPLYLVICLVLPKSFNSDFTLL